MSPIPVTGENHTLQGQPWSVIISDNCLFIKNETNKPKQTTEEVLFLTIPYFHFWKQLPEFAFQTQ